MFGKNDLTGRKRNMYLGWLIILLGVLGTFVLVWVVDSSSKEEDQLRFDYESRQIIRAITNRMTQYEIVMDQTRALFLSSDDVTQEEFREFIKNSKIFPNFPGIRGVAYALLIQNSELEKKIKEIQKSNPQFEIFPSSTAEKITAPILYYERNTESKDKPVGFDLFSEQHRRDALLTSWKTGEPTLSKKIFLFDGKKFGTEAGFILCIPVYGSKNGNKLAFIIAPLSIQKVFDTILRGRINQLDVEIFEGNSTAPENLIYDFDKSDYNTSNVPDYLKSTQSFKFQNHSFIVRFHSLPTFISNYSGFKELLILLLGFIITFIIFWIYRLTCQQVIMTQTAKDSLEHSVRARDEFFSIASHEFKTPLTSLKLQTQIFRRSGLKRDPKVYTDDYINSITQVLEKQIVRIERLVDDMLDVSRIRTGRLSIEKTDFNLSELVKDVISRMSEQLKILPEKAPLVKTSGDTFGHWDKLRIEQVITNLLSNAVKYGHETTVNVDIIGTQHEVLLKVKDHGEGIDPSNHQKIFNRFEQVGITPRGVAGLGLGLFITKRIVEAHQGEIWVESELGKGACFLVKLPKRT